MRRTFDSKFKARVALAAIKEEKSIAEIAGIYEVHPNPVRAWKKETLSKMADLFQNGRKKKVPPTLRGRRSLVEKNHTVLSVRQ